MFDFRYHAISLVAVLLALAIGLLLGVAIGDEGLVSSAERDIRSSLRGDVRDARADSDRLTEELESQQRFLDAAYPVMVGGRLSGLRIGLVGLGGLSDEVVDDVRASIEPAGATLSSVSVVREPLDVDAIAQRAEGTRLEALGSEALPPELRLELLALLGRRVGGQLVLGGQFINRVRPGLFASSSGELEGVQGVVLFRHQASLDDAERARVDAFENGFVVGVTRLGIPITGVEQTSTDPSQVTWFEERSLASVDHVDTLAGKLSLVLTLDGAEGSYGIKETADALIPTAQAALAG